MNAMTRRIYEPEHVRLFRQRNRAIALCVFLACVLVASFLIGRL